MRALDRAGSRPVRLRSRRIGRGEQVIELRLEALEEERLERLSKRLLRCEDVHDLSYRVVDGSAGLYAVNAGWHPATQLAVAG